MPLMFSPSALQHYTQAATLEQAPTAQAAPAPDRPNWFDRAAQIAFWGSTAADTATTAYGLAHGYQEADPLYTWAGNKGVAPLAAGVGVNLGIYLLARKLLQNHHAILNAGLLGASVAHGAGTLQNLQTLAQGGRP